MKVKADRITLKRWHDYHAHYRQGELLKFMVKMFMQQGLGRVLAMPNTVPPILTAPDALRYKGEIEKAIRITHEETGWPKIDPVMTIQITEQTTPSDIDAAAAEGIRFAKIYPKNMTTNSGNGVEAYMKLYPVMERVEKYNMIVLFHGESPNPQVEGLKKELFFLETFRDFVLAFPGTRFVLEHITTEAAVWCIAILPKNAAATITPHHLRLTLDNVIGYNAASGYKLRPHNFCKPIAKTEDDARALVMAAVANQPLSLNYPVGQDPRSLCILKPFNPNDTQFTSEVATETNNKFFCGTDTAPHRRETKECDGGCAGIFNTPVALASIVEIFEQQNALDQLEPFLSTRGSDFYGFEQSPDEISIIKQEWKVPDNYPVPGIDSVIVPFMAGSAFQWQLETTTP